MSRVTELAAAEADRVEGEEPDDSDGDHGETDPEPDTDSTPEPEPAEPPVDPKALERVVATYERNLRKILGAAADDMVPCTMCEGMGFTPGPVEPPREILQDPSLEPCPDCNAEGIVKTGSRRDGQEHRSCTHCSGNGYRTKTIELPVAGAGNGLTATAGQTAAPAAPGGPPDVYGRPWGHRDYGLHPATVNPS